MLLMEYDEVIKKSANDRLWHEPADPECPLHGCFWGECVAKLFAALQERNYRIRPNSTLNRYCAPALVLESILLNLVAKIVLQHIRGKTGQHLLAVSFSQFGPEAVIGRTEILQRSSLLPYGGVLSFRSEVPTAPASIRDFVACCEVIR
jgi:hypothetical protein